MTASVPALMLITDGLWIIDALRAPPFGKADRRTVLKATLCLTRNIGA